MGAAAVQRWFDDPAGIASPRHGLSRSHLVASLWFGLGIWLMHVTLGTFVATRPSLLSGPWFETPVVSLFVRDQVGTLTLLLALSAADRITHRDPGWRWTYFTAVVVAATAWLIAVTTIVRLTGLPLGWGPMRRTDPLVAQWAAYGFFEWLMLDGAATFIYLDAMRAHRERRRLRAAQAERMLAAKRLLESRLQAMQARVEPAFLFNTLAHVRKMYETQVASAERMLDDLIRYLRAAMPQMRSTSSTVGQEMELARAYVDIVGLGMRGRLVAEVHLAAGVAPCRLPPMMLLPMVDRALAREDVAAAHATTLRIECDSPVDEVLRIHIACQSAGLPHQTDDATLATLRDRLGALYGDRYRLVVSGGAGLASHTTLEIPLERMAPPAADSPGVLACAAP